MPQSYYIILIVIFITFILVLILNKREKKKTGEISSTYIDALHLLLEGKKARPFRNLKPQ